MKAAESVSLPAGAGYSLPLQWFAAESATATVVMMAALGMGARFYQPLASALQEKGINVALLEQRGHGDSAWQASRRCDWGFREPLVDEIPAALEWLKTTAPDQPVYLMGHSLGGHYAAMAAGLYPTQVDGVILAACGSPWVGGFSGKTARQLKILCKLIPPACALLGYYPGKQLGFGGREARTLMTDWLAVANTNRYQASGLSEDLDSGIAAYTGPVLCLRMQDDAFAPRESVHAVSDKFIQAEVEHRVLNTQVLGDQADHFRWARKPEAVTQTIATWLDNL
jgi:predicted alpha/beta hydrolase